MRLEELDLAMTDSARFAGGVFGGVKDGYLTDVSDRYCSTSRAVVLSALSQLEVSLIPMVVVEISYCIELSGEDRPALLLTA